MFRLILGAPPALGLTNVEVVVEARPLDVPGELPDVSSELGGDVLIGQESLDLHPRGHPSLLQVEQVRPHK